MNKQNFILLASILCALNFLTAQNDNNDKGYFDDYQLSDSRFSIIGYGGVGYAVIDNNNQPNYNLNATTFDILLDYRIGSRWGIATGLGFNQLSGTGFDNSGQNFYHERGTLKIPLLLSGNYAISPRMRMVVNAGFYAQTILKDDFSYVNNTTIGDIYEGWNFGVQTGIGMSYHIDDRFSLGIMFNTQGDLSRFDNTLTTTPNDQQKIKSVNTVGLLFTYQL